MQSDMTETTDIETSVGGPRFCYTPSIPFVSGAYRAVSQKGKQWRVGETINISFIGGTRQQRELVIKWASPLQNYANIFFNWNSPKIRSDVRISFKRGHGSWSYIGTDATYIPVNQATMNFGWLDEAVVLHEFGHMLSLLHEHSNPNSGIEFNKPVVIKDLKGPPNHWSLKTIDYNVFRKVSEDEANATRFDAYSIMLYHYPPTWTLNMNGTNKNTKLSPTDKEHLRFLYPETASEVYKPRFFHRIWGPIKNLFGC